MALSLFTSDVALLKDIATELSACGCCARCTLRYLGLKDMYFYKGNLQEMEEMVKEYKHGTVKNDGKDTTTESVDAEINGAYTEKDNAEETGDVDDPVNKNTDSDVVVGNKDSDNVQTSDKEVESDNKETTVDTKEAVNSVKSGSDDTQTASLMDVDACSGVSQGESGANERKAYISMGDRDSKTSPCVVCLGILQNFCSEKYLNELKQYIEDEGFQYSVYMCSMMIPVCIILREYALMLHLKEKFSSVYQNKKYTDVAQIKDVWKWRCGPLLTEILGTSFDAKSKFEITLTFVYEHSNKECSFLLDAEDNDTFRKRKQDRRYNRKKTTFAVYTRSNVAKAAEEMPEQEFRRSYQCPPSEPRAYTKCDVKCQNENVFVGGRYNKYSRTLSQTPWLIDGVSKTESSVEELLESEIHKNFRPSEIKFSSSGREDVDVLMLGNGRPFVLELVNPRRREFTQEQMTAMQKVLNASTKDIRCRDLQIVTKEETDILKEGEIDKVKKYSALCWSKLPVTDKQLTTLSDIKDLTLLQKTPIRVLHRRPLSTRARMIHQITATRKDEHHFQLDMSTQAGTYVKEFVHSDFGRTKPNVSSLLSQECDILELDVNNMQKLENVIKYCSNVIDHH